MKTQRCNACGWPGQVINTMCSVCGLSIDAPVYHNAPDPLDEVRDRLATKYGGVILPKNTGLIP